VTRAAAPARYRGELALGSSIYLRARSYDAHLGRFTTRDPVNEGVPQVAAAVSPYAYASNDPVNRTDPLGLFSFGSIVSAVAHVAGHVVHAVAHAVHSATGAITHTAQIVAGATAHAFDAVNNALANVAQLALLAAAHVAHAVMDGASQVVHAVSDAVSRTVGIVSNAARATWHWVQKHNEVFGKIGSILSNVSGGLALAGLIIAPIPGLDALTPVLEGAAAATSLGALAAQGIAKAAGDRDVSYGDLIGDSLGIIPGIGAAGRDADEAVEATKTLDLVDETGSSVEEDSAAFRGDSQASPGGQAGPPVSLGKLKMALGRAGMSVRKYDLVHVPEILDANGELAYGVARFTGEAAELGPRGLPLIEISDLGLSSMNEAVATVFHEIYHVDTFTAFGWPGTEASAEEFGQKMLARFLSRVGG
jgi:RHS repeat-associated protein